jgi:hypothetical protein
MLALRTSKNSRARLAPLETALMYAARTAAENDVGLEGTAFSWPWRYVRENGARNMAELTPPCAVERWLASKACEKTM